MISKIISFIICNPPVMNTLCIGVPVLAIILGAIKIKDILQE
jgi:hypothetical protein|nr:MAG TPA: hypothetical protein [Caudoviricetes sp.]